MNIEKVKITFKDGTSVIAKVNGNNYITEENIEKKLGRENLKTISIGEHTYTDMVACNYWHEDNGYHTVFKKMSKAQLENENLKKEIKELQGAFYEMAIGG